MGFLFATPFASYLYVLWVHIELTEERLFCLVCSRDFDFLEYRQGGTFDFGFLLLSYVHLDVIMALLSDPSWNTDQGV